MRTVQKILIGVVIICLAVIMLGIVVFKINVFLLDLHIKDRISKVEKQKSEIVGTTKAELAFIGVDPIYSSSGELESITIHLSAKLPKSGEYQIDGYLIAKDVFKAVYQKPNLYILGITLFDYDVAEGKKPIQIVFNSLELQQNNYNGPVEFSIYNIWRKDIAIDEAFGGGTVNSAVVQFIDIGEISVGSYPLRKIR